MGCAADEITPHVGPASDDLKLITGSDKMTVGAPLAEIILPQSENEKRLMAVAGDKAFYRIIMDEYPDIAAIKYNPPAEIQGHQEEIEYESLDFFRGLYFAKKIILANGQSLFDFLKKCSRNLSPLNGAEEDLSMQFYPVLRQKGSGKEIEMQISFNRVDDLIKAQSPWFSSSVLKNPNFMAQHDLECWK